MRYLPSAGSSRFRFDGSAASAASQPDWAPRGKAKARPFPGERQGESETERPRGRCPLGLPRSISSNAKGIGEGGRPVRGGARLEEGRPD